MFGIGQRASRVPLAVKTEGSSSKRAGPGRAHHTNVNEPRTGLRSPLVGVCTSRCQTPASLPNQSMAKAESGRGIVPETEGKYSVELFKDGEGAG